jgi:hypothetical protein
MRTKRVKMARRRTRNSECLSLKISAFDEKAATPRDQGNRQLRRLCSLRCCSLGGLFIYVTYRPHGSLVVKNLAKSIPPEIDESWVVANVILTKIYSNDHFSLSEDETTDLFIPFILFIAAQVPETSFTGTKFSRTG